MSSVLNVIRDSLLNKVTVKPSLVSRIVTLRFFVVGMFLIVKLQISPHRIPMRHVLNPDFFHFSGALSGSSGMSNSIVMVGLSLSIVIEYSDTEPIATCVLNILLNRMLFSISFQYFIFYP